MMLEKGIATVTVGFPATVLAGGRVRFCISAAHTREMLNKVYFLSKFLGPFCTSMQHDFKFYLL